VNAFKVFEALYSGLGKRASSTGKFDEVLTLRFHHRYHNFELSQDP
jgi:hypothetical protein